MQYEVFIPAVDENGFDVTLVVDAINWMAALKTGLERCGESPNAVRSVVCDIQADQSIHVTDAASMRIFKLRELPQEEEAPPEPSPEATALPTVALPTVDALLTHEPPTIQPPEPEPAPEPEPQPSASATRIYQSVEASSLEDEQEAARDLLPPSQDEPSGPPLDAVALPLEPSLPNHRGTAPIPRFLPAEERDTNSVTAPISAEVRQALAQEDQAQRGPSPTLEPRPELAKPACVTPEDPTPEPEPTPEPTPEPAPEPTPEPATEPESGTSPTEDTARLVAEELEAQIRADRQVKEVTPEPAPAEAKPEPKPEPEPEPEPAPTPALPPEPEPAKKEGRVFHPSSRTIIGEMPAVHFGQARISAKAREQAVQSEDQDSSGSEVDSSAATVARVLRESHTRSSSGIKARPTIQIGVVDVHAQVADNALEDIFLEIPPIFDGMKIPDAADFVLDLAMEKIKSESGSVMFATSQGDELFFATTRGPRAADVKDYRLPMGEGVGGFVAREGVSLLIADVEQDERFYEAISRSIGYKVTSIICAPIQHESRVYGCIELINPTDRGTYSNAQVDALKYIGEQFGQMIMETHMRQD